MAILISGVQIMPTVLRTVAAALLLAFLGACGSDPPKPKTPVPKIKYADEKVDPSVFKDDASANRKVGADDLSLTFKCPDGKTISIMDYRGKAPVVLVVLRGIPETQGGVFCPGCLAQTGSFAANSEAFKTRGAEVLLVFPGKADRLNEFVQQAKTDAKVNTPAGLPFPILLDVDLAACTKLGIRADLAKPSTYVLDRQGNVVYAYVGENYIDRPSLKAILGQLDKLPKAEGG